MADIVDAQRPKHNSTTVALIETVEIVIEIQ